ncbi:MAG: hypothetical protein RIS94_2846 [Pseudomonadota bacterium]|jgi:hypothetical protein
MNRIMMAHALRLVALPVLPLAELARVSIVLGCTLSLMLAGKALPF